MMMMIMMISEGTLYDKEDQQLCQYTMEDSMLVNSMMMLMVNVMVTPTQSSRSMQWFNLISKKSIAIDNQSASVLSAGSARVKTGGDRKHYEGCSGFQIFKSS